MRSREVQTNKRPSPVLRGLAELDFPIIATTNYDRLFETALLGHSRDPQVAVYANDRRGATPDYTRHIFPTPTEPFVVKIHGDIDHPESIVITDEDYIHFLMRMGDPDPFQAIPQTLRFGLMKFVTLFIGYSLLDYNLRLLFKTLRWQLDRSSMPQSYAVDPYPDHLIRDVYAKRNGYIHFIVHDVWSFVPDLYKKLKGRDLPQ